jgi:ATP-dependent Zn protease
MGQLPQQPPYSMGQAPAPTPRHGRFGRGLFGWVLFIGIAAMLFMLLSKKNKVYQTVPLSEFIKRLEAKQVQAVSIEGDEIFGTVANSRSGGPIRADLPPGLSGNWDFVRWLLEKAGEDTVVQVRSQNNYVVNILVPLIPWVLIFGFIWFFVFRQLRRAGAAAQPHVITGPGRWVPDEPGKAGQV